MSDHIDKIVSSVRMCHDGCYVEGDLVAVAEAAFERGREIGEHNAEGDALVAKADTLRAVQERAVLVAEDTGDAWDIVNLFTFGEFEVKEVE